VLIDTNIVVDVLTHRAPFFENSQMILLLSEHRYINGFVSATAMTDIFYITAKLLGNKEHAKNLLKKLVGTINIATIDGNMVVEALDFEWNDFEDAVQYVVGKNIAAEYLVTRNPKDFSGDKITTVEPEDLLNIITAG
jgi:predicted nucleic acid-binding protein